MRIAVPAAAVVAVAALALSACSSTSNGTPTNAPSPTGQAPSSASTPTGFPSSSSSAPTTGGLSEAQATAALLTAAEVGGGFSQTQSDDSDTPLPCTPNEPTLSQQFPPDVKVQVDFASAAGNALISEEIETFADADAVAQVVAAGEQGLSCGTTTVGGTRVKIDGPTDVTSKIQVPVDKAEAWVVKSAPLNASLIIVQTGQQLVVFSFGAPPSVDTTKLPDPGHVVTAGLEKVNAALK
jgi:hypothetical protein